MTLIQDNDMVVDPFNNFSGIGDKFDEMRDYLLVLSASGSESSKSYWNLIWPSSELTSETLKTVPRPKLSSIDISTWVMVAWGRLGKASLSWSNRKKSSWDEAGANLGPEMFAFVGVEGRKSVCTEE